MELATQIACRQEWPTQHDFLFKDAIAALAPSLLPQWDALQQRKALISQLDEAAAIPLIGVMGLLNAGKSSFVAQFLNDPQRVLRGNAGHQGTQRFVLWLPLHWREQPLLALLQQELRATFGQEGVLLSENPEEAHQQYNGQGNIRELFTLPLLGFDPGLTSFGLIDCPDFERKHPGTAPGENPTALRRSFVEKAARLISATVVIADRSKIASDQLHQFLQIGSLQGKPRFLLINRVPPFEKELDLLEDSEVRAAEEALGVTKVYGAYDYHMRGAEEKIPGFHPEQAAPTFFSLPISAPPHLIQQELSRLDASDLWRNRLEREERQVAADQFALIRALEEDLQTQRAKLEALRLGAMEFVQGVMTVGHGEGDQEGGLKCPITPETTDQVMKAVLESAPLWAKPTLYARLGVRMVQTLASKAAHQLQTLLNPADKAKAHLDEIRDNLRRTPTLAFLNPEELARRSRNLRWLPEGTQEAELAAAWEKILKQLEQFYPHYTFDQADLKAYGTKVWESVPLMKRLVLVATGPLTIVAGLLAITLAPFDGGGTTLVLAASLHELFAVLGIGGGLASLAGQKLEADFVRKMAIPFYREMIGMTLDGFGLPRSGPAFQHEFSGVGRVTFPDGENDLVVKLAPPALPLGAGSAVAQLDPSFRNAAERQEIR